MSTMEVAVKVVLSTDTVPASSSSVPAVLTQGIVGQGAPASSNNAVAGDATPVSSNTVVGRVEPMLAHTANIDMVAHPSDQVPSPARPSEPMVESEPVEPPEEFGSFPKDVIGAADPGWDIERHSSGFTKYSEIQRNGEIKLVGYPTMSYDTPSARKKQYVSVAGSGMRTPTHVGTYRAVGNRAPDPSSGVGGGEVYDATGLADGSHDPSKSNKKNTKRVSKSAQRKSKKPKIPTKPPTDHDDDYGWYQPIAASEPTDFNYKSNRAASIRKDKAIRTARREKRQAFEAVKPKKLFSDSKGMPTVGHAPFFPFSTTSPAAYHSPVGNDTSNWDDGKAMRDASESEIAYKVMSKLIDSEPDVHRRKALKSARKLVDVHRNTAWKEARKRREHKQGRRDRYLAHCNAVDLRSLSDGISKVINVVRSPFAVRPVNDADAATAGPTPFTNVPPTATVTPGDDVDNSSVLAHSPPLDYSHSEESNGSPPQPSRDSPDDQQGFDAMSRSLLNDDLGHLLPSYHYHDPLDYGGLLPFSPLPSRLTEADLDNLYMEQCRQLEPEQEKLFHEFMQGSEAAPDPRGYDASDESEAFDPSVASTIDSVSDVDEDKATKFLANMSARCAQALSTDPPLVALTTDTATQVPATTAAAASPPNDTTEGNGSGAAKLLDFLSHGVDSLCLGQEVTVVDKYRSHGVRMSNGPQPRNILKSTPFMRNNDPFKGSFSISRVDPSTEPTDPETTAELPDNKSGRRRSKREWEALYGPLNDPNDDEYVPPSDHPLDYLYRAPAINSRGGERYIIDHYTVMSPKAISRITDRGIINEELILNQLTDPDFASIYALGFAHRFHAYSYPCNQRNTVTVFLRRNPEYVDSSIPADSPQRLVMPPSDYIWRTGTTMDFVFLPHVVDESERYIPEPGDMVGPLYPAECEKDGRGNDDSISYTDPQDSAWIEENDGCELENDHDLSDDNFMPSDDEVVQNPPPKIINKTVFPPFVPTAPPVHVPVPVVAPPMAVDPVDCRPLEHSNDAIASEPHHSLESSRANADTPLQANRTPAGGLESDGSAVRRVKEVADRVDKAFGAVMTAGLYSNLQNLPPAPKTSPLEQLGRPPSHADRATGNDMSSERVQTRSGGVYMTSDYFPNMSDMPDTDFDYSQPVESPPPSALPNPRPEMVRNEIECASDDVLASMFDRLYKQYLRQRSTPSAPTHHQEANHNTANRAPSSASRQRHESPAPTFGIPESASRQRHGASATASSRYPRDERHGDFASPLGNGSGLTYRDEEPRTTSKILSELAKNADRIGITPLKSGSTVHRRIQNFLRWFSDLQSVLSMTNELQVVLADPDRISEPATPEASIALRGFLFINVDREAQDVLREFFTEYPAADGVDTFIKIRELFAPRDYTSRQLAFNEFCNLAIGPNETFRQFNARFNELRLYVRISGQVLSSNDIVDQYLRSIEMVRNQAMQVDICNYIKIRETEIKRDQARTSLSITQIQSSLQRDEERRNQLEDLSRNQRTPSFAQARKTSRKSHANATDSAKKPPPKSTKGNPSPKKSPNPKHKDLECYGCGVKGHVLADCRTVSDVDKKAYFHQQHAAKPKPNSDKTVRFKKTKEVMANNARRVVYSASVVCFANKVARKRKSTVKHHEPRVLVYEDDIIIDSGASDHMTGQNVLFHTYEFPSHVMLPDGSQVFGSTAGILRFNCRCLETGKVHIVPLAETIYVKGFVHTLLSVAAFAASGHEIVFGLSTIRLIIQKGTKNEVTIHLNHPYYRHQTPMFANNIKSKEEPHKPTVSFELLHNRLGHPSFKTLLAAEKANMFDDVKVQFDNPGPCVDCAIGQIRVKNAGKKPVAPSVIPGEIWFVDIVDNPSSVGLNEKSYFAQYLNIIDSATRFQFFVGMEDKEASSVIKALESIVHTFRPHSKFTMDDIAEIHVDYGSQLKSKKLRDWGAKHKSPIRIISAAPHHQEQNGKAEAGWRHVRLIINKLLSHASLGPEFFDVALAYACSIKNVLPLKGVQTTANSMPASSQTTAKGARNKSKHPTHNAVRVSDALVSPYQLYFGRRPPIRRFRIFGSPCVSKVYRRSNRDHVAVQTKHLVDRNIFQRGVRGIFVGFPTNSAGYLIWNPASSKLMISEDVAFDEHFQSSMAMPRRLFHDAKPIREHGWGKKHHPSGRIPHEVVVDFPVGSLQYYEDTTSDWPSSPLIASNDLDQENARHSLLPTAQQRQSSAEEESESSTEEDELDYSDSDNEDADNSVDEDEYDPTITTSNKQVNGDANNNNSSSDFDCDERFASRKDSVIAPVIDPVIRRNPFYIPDETEDDDSDSESEASLEEYAPHNSAANVRKSKRIRRGTENPDFEYPNRKTRRAIRAYVHSAIKKLPLSKPERKEMSKTFEECLPVMPGDPGSDPTFFIPEPRSLHQVAKMPLRYQIPWKNSFVKEFKGLAKRKTYKIATPEPGEPVTPVMELFRCKLDQNGTIDKLKCRVVFRGDLYDPTEPEDSWNPFASYQALRMFLAICARYKIFPAQTDWVQAYLQCQMRERVFITFPEYWKKFLPEDLAAYCGIPLLLLRALYGYTYSGKRLYEEQEEFLLKQGFVQSTMLGIWVKHLLHGGLFILLLFADDLLSACTDSSALHQFKIALSARFEVSWKPVADWYLQARIEQDPYGNISIDQSRYSKSIVQRYIPNTPETPTAKDMFMYLNPLPRDCKWTKDDNSATIEDVQALEREYGYRYIEVVGSLNYLANTAIRVLYGIRKLCKFTRAPGRRHYEALNHILHHIRCYPTEPLKYFPNVMDSPLAKMLIEAGHNNVDPTFVYFTDSSFQDCDDARSTGCYLGFLQGGLIDMASAVPSLISHSSAEAETTFASAACLATFPTRRALMFILHNDEDREFTVPMFTDSQSSIDIAKNSKGTQRTKHMARRYLFTREVSQNGSILFLHIKGKEYQLADIGTKGDIPHIEFDFKTCVINGSRFTANAITPVADPKSNPRGVLGSGSTERDHPVTDDVPSGCSIGNEKPRSKIDTGGADERANRTQLAARSRRSAKSIADKKPVASGIVTPRLDADVALQARAIDRRARSVHWKQEQTPGKGTTASRLDS
jgi:Reverse transcriptase (RNA-dependent DNA polymerase)